MALLNTSGGTDKTGKVLLFRIPLKERDTQHESPTPPQCFEKITYGHYYDLANGELAE